MTEITNGLVVVMVAASTFDVDVMVGRTVEIAVTNWTALNQFPVITLSSYLVYLS